MEVWNESDCLAPPFSDIQANLGFARKETLSHCQSG